MKIKSVSYQKAFNIGPFLQEKIGLEIEIDDTESAESALSTAKEIAESWHKANNPQLEGMTITEVLPHPSGIIDEPLVPREQRIAALIADINSCCEVKVLESYRLMAKVNDQLQAAYDNKMKELTVNQ